MDGCKVVSLRNSILEAIGNLATNGSNCEKMIESGILLPLIEKILPRNLESAKPDKETLELHKVLASPLLCNLTKPRTTQDVFLTIGVVPLVVYWMNVESDDEQPQKGAIEVLANFSTNETAVNEFAQLPNFVSGLENATGMIVKCNIVIDRAIAE